MHEHEIVLCHILDLLEIRLDLNLCWTAKLQQKETRHNFVPTIIYAWHLIFNYSKK